MLVERTFSLPQARVSGSRRRTLAIERWPSPQPRTPPAAGGVPLRIPVSASSVSQLGPLAREKPELFDVPEACHVVSVHPASAAGSRAIDWPGPRTGMARRPWPSRPACSRSPDVGAGRIIRRPRFSCRSHRPPTDPVITSRPKTGISVALVSAMKFRRGTDWRSSLHAAHRYGGVRPGR